MFLPTMQLLADGKRWEGERLKVYKDSLGYATQGIGRHTGVQFGDPDIDQLTEARWFGEDINTAYFGAATLFPQLDSYDSVRRDAIVWLVFNMGINTLSQFVPFCTYVKARKWSEAAYHLLTNTSQHLTPYLQQTGVRAVETALRIATGEVLEEFRA
jgi:GH24 family phage-related lysozyme (muramidase)